MIENQLQGIENQLQGLARKLADTYLEPKSFEMNGRLYEMLGIRQFGSAYRKIFDSIIKYGQYKDKKWVENFSSDSLESLVDFTKMTEQIHLGPFIATNALMIVELAIGNYPLAIGCGVVNTVVNLYPIMLQRYNRNRINKILKWRKKND